MADGLDRFIHYLFDGDLKKAGRFVVQDVIKPRVKQILWEAGSGALRTVIYDEGAPESKGANPYWKGANGKPKGEYNPLAREWNKNDKLPSNTAKPEKKLVSMNNYRYISYYTGKEAARVRDTLIERLEELANTPGKVPMVMVSDMASLSELEFEHTCCNYGWDDLTGVDIVSFIDEKTGDTKYRVKWPQAKPRVDLL